MFIRFNRATAALLAGLTASFMTLASPAAAQDEYSVVVRGTPEGHKMQLVSYRDLNLNLIAHRKILDDRVGNAVRDVCDIRTGNQLSPDYRLCNDEAWAGAKPQITRAYVRAAQLAYGNR